MKTDLTNIQINSLIKKTISIKIPLRKIFKLFKNKKK